MRTHKVSNLLGNLPDRVACWFTQIIVANVVEALRCFNKYFWTTFFLTDLHVNFQYHRHLRNEQYSPLRLVRIRELKI